MDPARLSEETDFRCTDFIQTKKVAVVVSREAAEACVYLEAPSTQNTAELPEGPALLAAEQDPYHAECAGWRERGGAGRGELPRCFQYLHPC